MLRRAMPSNTRGAVSLSKSSFRPSQGDCQSSLLSLCTRVKEDYKIFSHLYTIVLVAYLMKMLVIG